MTFWICRTCAVEHAERVETCAICDDERQWVPESGQQWTTLADLAAEGRKVTVFELEPDLFGVASEPSAGIGQTAKLVRTDAGSLLWDPIGFLDEEGARQVRELGEVKAIAASHPHMFGVQVEWSRALGGVPVLVNEADAEWVARPDPVIETWSGNAEPLPGVTLVQAGGHFPGSCVVHWQAGAGGKGVLLGGDTVKAGPDQASVSFMRSYPNFIPLSAGVVERIATQLESYEFDRLYDNFRNVVRAGAKSVLRRSADRYIGWVRGDFDHLT